MTTKARQAAVDKFQDNESINAKGRKTRCAHMCKYSRQMICRRPRHLRRDGPARNQKRCREAKVIPRHMPVHAGEVPISYARVIFDWNYGSYILILLFYRFMIVVFSSISRVCFGFLKQITGAHFKAFLQLMILLLGALAGQWCSATPDAIPDHPEIRILRFDDITPEGARLTTCWDAVGIDEHQRVYIAFSDQSAQHPFDTMIFRYDTESEERRLLGTLRQISQNDGNLRQDETIAKIHVPFRAHEGKFYFSSHDYHTYSGPAELPQHRGGHFYSYDLRTGYFHDLSKTDANGISVAQQGIIGMTVLPKQNLLAGFTFPYGDILIHDLEKQKTTYYRGVPEHRDGGKPSRQIFSNNRGKVFFTYYDRRPAALYAFDTLTGKIQQTSYSFQFGMLYGALPTRDARKLYLVDLFGDLYVFHTNEERLEELGSLLPPEEIAAGVKVEICYTIVLSPDEKKIYSFPSRLSIAPALRLYELDLESGRRRQVADFTATLNGSSDGTPGDRHGRITGCGVYDARGRLYFGYHESGDDGRNGALLQITLPVDK